jgi:two-component system, response regulator
MNGSNVIKILLVEDNSYDAELTITTLKDKKLSNNIHHVRNGAEALDYLFDADGSLRQGEPHIILLDLKMPKVHGIEVLRRIKSHEKAKKIPVVVFTSSNLEKDMEECYRLGVNSFVTKPLEFDSFVNAVSNFGLYWLLLNAMPESQQD